MVQPAFDIRKNEAADMPENGRLLIEISAQSFNYILFTKDPDRLHILRQYRMYTTGDKNARDILEEIISGDAILQSYASKAIVVYNFPESNLLPSEVFDVNLKTPVTSLIYGYSDHHIIFDEPVKDLDMHNVYFISRDLHSLCREKFKGSEFWHIYTILLRWCANSKVARQSASTTVLFYNDKFVAAVFRHGKLQLIQTFSYQTPEDASYYLLLIAKQFGISPEEMIMQISGLIDTQSALYTELLKYFVHVRYDGIPETYDTNALLDEYPAHYFSPLLKMSLCV